MPDPAVAWKVVEPGRRVVGDGGTVLSRTKYVPSEEAAGIYEGEIVLAPGAQLRDPT